MQQSDPQTKQTNNEIDAYFSDLDEHPVAAPSHLANRIETALDGSSHHQQPRNDTWLDFKKFIVGLKLESPLFATAFATPARALAACIIPLALGFSVGFTGSIEGEDGLDYTIETYLFATSIEDEGGDYEF